MLDLAARRCRIHRKSGSKRSTKPYFSNHLSCSSPVRKVCFRLFHRTRECLRLVFVSSTLVPTVFCLSRHGFDEQVQHKIPDDPRQQPSFTPSVAALEMPQVYTSIFLGVYYLLLFIQRDKRRSARTFHLSPYSAQWGVPSQPRNLIILTSTTGSGSGVTSGSDFFAHLGTHGPGGEPPGDDPEPRAPDAAPQFGQPVLALLSIVPAARSARYLSSLSLFTHVVAWATRCDKTTHRARCLYQYILWFIVRYIYGGGGGGIGSKVSM